jgi:hypothetical protein
MIVVITVPGHGFTLKSFIDGTYGFPVPELRLASYEDLLRARRVPRATYVFADIERLTAWELRIVADLYRVLRHAGLRCLNNPAYAMARIELLHALYAAGLNSFQAWRADEKPRPPRFPVFVRNEGDHGLPLPDIVADQDQLDRVLATMQANGIPLRGTMVLEIRAEPYRPGLWAKWGTFRVGDRLSVDHIGVDDTWFVKYGDRTKLTEEAIRDEHDAVASNRFATALRPAFDLAHIEFGRADHAMVDGRVTVYEINTNPYVGYFAADPHPLRLDSQRIARQRLSACFDEINTLDAGSVNLGATTLLDQVRALPPHFMTPRP